MLGFGFVEFWMFVCFKFFSCRVFVGIGLYCSVLYDLFIKGYFMCLVVCCFKGGVGRIMFLFNLVVVFVG